MTDPVMNELNRRFKPLLDKLVYLHDRWQDEHEYEDWKDYVAAMQKLVPDQTTFLKASKRPFGFDVKTSSNGGFRFFASATKAGFGILEFNAKAQ